ncbi:MAG: spondin domain-containing protein [Fibrobacterales bacterium]
MNKNLLITLACSGLLFTGCDIFKKSDSDTPPPTSTMSSSSKLMSSNDVAHMSSSAMTGMSSDDMAGASMSSVAMTTQTFDITIKNISTPSPLQGYGMVGDAPLAPDSEWSFTVSNAQMDSKISLATMFVQSNDWFYGFAPEGLALYNEDGTALSGDITDKIMLWDAGTEMDEPIGAGHYQAPRQTGPNSGMIDPVAMVRPVAPVTAASFGDAPAGPGGSYSFSFKAMKGQKLSLATMFVQSNDWFYGTKPEGIALYGMDGMAISGNITDKIMLWDAGTEMDQEIATGSYQAPRQSGPNMGEPDLNTLVRMVEGHSTPVEHNIDVTLEAMADNMFTVTIQVKAESTTPLAPGVYVIHQAPAPLFNSGVMDFNMGLEALAEDGSPTALATVLTTMDHTKPDANIMVSVTSTTAGTFEFTITVKATSNTPLAPAVWALHTSGTPLYSNLTMDMGNGLEALAEDGNAAPLADYLKMNAIAPTVFAPGVAAVSAMNMILFSNTMKDMGLGLEALAEDGNPAPLHTNLMDKGIATTTFGDAPLPTGGMYTLTVDAKKGDMLYLATMFVHSNDLFFGTPENGLPLWDTEGMPINGDVTNSIMLWDAGTEVNEMPGTGSNQAPRQGAANTGSIEDGMVMAVSDGFMYPVTNEAIMVIVTPVP